ncbi:hypothetical protein C0J09_03355 [Bordetella avium]|nr:hypothetical protein C0J09_03355 [Bordetella avium]
MLACCGKPVWIALSIVVSDGFVSASRAADINLFYPLDQCDCLGDRGERQPAGGVLHVRLAVEVNRRKCKGAWA